MRISDWSSDVCSSDLAARLAAILLAAGQRGVFEQFFDRVERAHDIHQLRQVLHAVAGAVGAALSPHVRVSGALDRIEADLRQPALPVARRADRSEEHTSELQSLMRISYAVFCLKKKTKHQEHNNKSSNNAQYIKHKRPSPRIINL